MKRFRAFVIAPSSLNFYVIFLYNQPISDSYLMILFTVSLTLMSGLRALKPLLSVRIKSLEIFCRQNTTYFNRLLSLIPCSTEPLYLTILSCSFIKDGLIVVWFIAVALKLACVWFKFGTCFFEFKFSLRMASKSKPRTKLYFGLIANLTLIA